MIVRIELSEGNSRVSYLPLGCEAREGVEPEADVSGTVACSPGGGRPAADNAPVTVMTPGAGAALGIEWGLGLEAAGLGNYGSPMYAHPVVSIGLQVPDADQEVLRVWLGATAGGAVVPSETLVRRMTNSVLGAMRGYFSGMSRAGNFTRPFRVGVALKLVNGKHLLLGEPRLVSPNGSAPLMLIREQSLNGAYFSTLTEIVNTPASLSVSVEPFSLPEELAGRVVSVDVIATREADVLAGDEQVTAIRTYSYMGENCLGWYYAPLAEDLVRARAEGDEAFRVLRSVPISEALAGIEGLEVPGAGVSLEDWSSLAAVTFQGADDPDTPEEPDDYEFVRVETVPLDLGYPEVHKLIRAVSVRGVFPRRTASNVAGRQESWVALYGSHHRDVWHRVAVSRGPHIAGLRGVRYRWLRVVIAGPRGARYDALTFHL